ncbi:MAG: type II toxin-antitoxin system HicA family toxin [Spirochaetota bacterium]
MAHSVVQPLIFPSNNTIYMMYCRFHDGQQVIVILEAKGWTLDRINGSHHVMIKHGRRSIPVPVHGNADLGFSPGGSSAKPGSNRSHYGLPVPSPRGGGRPFCRVP